MSDQLYLVFAVVFAGGFVHGAAGFGFALIAMPIAATALGMTHAVPLMNLLASLLCAQNLYLNRRSVVWREALPLVAGSAPGLILGICLLHVIHPDWMKQLLGAILLLYGIYAIYQEWRGSEAPENKTAALFAARGGLSALTGFIGGFFGGACACDGPPVAVLGDYQRWSKERFRANLQVFFLFNGVMLTMANIALGYLDTGLAKRAAYIVPILFAGSLTGYLASARMNSTQFRQAVLVLVMLMAVNLLLR